jgi:hypothetical protein
MHAPETQSTCVETESSVIAGNWLLTSVLLGNSRVSSEVRPARGELQGAVVVQDPGSRDPRRSVLLEERLHPLEEIASHDRVRVYQDYYLPG